MVARAERDGTAPGPRGRLVPVSGSVVLPQGVGATGSDDLQVSPLAYNEVDCKVMMEIVQHLREHH